MGKDEDDVAGCVECGNPLPYGGHVVTPLCDACLSKPAAITDDEAAKMADALSLEAGVEDALLAAEDIASRSNEPELADCLARLEVLWNLGGIHFALKLLDEARLSGGSAGSHRRSSTMRVGWSGPPFGEERIMRKLFVVLFVVLALAAVCTAPVAACNQICRYSGAGDRCDTVGWITGMSCYMSGPICIDQQEVCWTPKEEDKAEFLAQQIGVSEEPTPVCAAP